MKLSTVFDHNASGPSRGYVAWNLPAPDSGCQPAVLDLAWPSGLQKKLSQPEAVLPNGELPTLGIAGTAGSRCLAGSNAFKSHFRHDVLAGGIEP
jgi:hypothetical protein